MSALSETHGPDFNHYNAHVTPVKQQLDEIQSRGYPLHQVWEDWLDLMLYALQSKDEPYLEIVANYPNDRPEGQREIDHYAAAFTKLQQGMAATNADLLGVLYEEYAIQNKSFGQFFTPHSVAEMMAAMNEVTTKTEDQDGPQTVADPACGSGRMLLAALKQEPEGVFFGQDKDLTCVKMTALNLCFFNVDGYAIHGDSLLNERRRVWMTQRTALGGTIRELDSEEFVNPFEEWSQNQEENEKERTAEPAESSAVADTPLSRFL